MKALPDMHVLTQVDYAYFGSITFKGKVPVQHWRKSMWFAFVYQIARMWKVKPSSLIWVHREERGEQFGRLHHHYLLSAGNHVHGNPGTCFALMALWEKLGGGISRVRPYESSLGGVDYVCKCLGGGDTYEMSKFNASTSALTLSHRLASLLKRERSVRKQWAVGSSDPLYLRTIRGDRQFTMP